MTREEITRMAREVDPVTAILLDKKTQQGMDHECFVWFLERFAALVAAAEREACAKVCDDIDAEYEGEDVLATWCAAAIRVRGQE